MRTAMKIFLVLLLVSPVFQFFNYMQLHARNYEIKIGNEIGPMHVVGPPGQNWFIRIHHPVFADSSYFWGGVDRCKIDHDWVYRFSDLRDPDDNVTPNLQSQIFSDLGLKTWLKNGDFTAYCQVEDSSITLDGQIAWRSEKYIDTLLIDDELWFDVNHGNSATVNYDPSFYWEGDHNPGGFIIGDPDAVEENTLVVNNWVNIKKYYALMNFDKYRISIRMQRSADTEDDEDPIGVFFLGSGSYPNYGIGWFKEIKNSDFTEDPGEWEWLDIDIPVTMKPNGHGYALRWSGSFDEQNERVTLKLDRILYEGYMHQKLFPNGSEEPEGPFLSALLDSLQSDINCVGAENVLGWMTWEPWLFGYKTFSELAWSASIHFLIRQPNLYRFTAQYPGYSSEEMETYLTETGVSSMYFDQWCIRWDNNGWHWELSEDGDADIDKVGGGSDNINMISIQDAWNKYIEGWSGPPNIIHHGIRYAIEAAREHDPPVEIHLGIQSSGDLKWDDGNHEWVNSDWQDPTPRMVKCQGYLAMTFAPDGYLYSYYGPRYARTDDSTYHPGPTYYSQPPYECQQKLNGAFVSGLVTICQDNTDASDTSITSHGELVIARGTSEGNYENGKGWLRQNPKWYAAKEFNKYIRKYDPIFSSLQLRESECVCGVYGEGADIDFVTDIVTATDSEMNNEDDEDSIWVQVGTFEDYHFMLVNRRCDENGGRWVSCTIDFSADPVVSHTIYAFNKITVQTKASGLGNLTILDYLPPGEGKLYFCALSFLGDIDDECSIRGVYLVENEITVSSGGGILRVLPGSQLIFKDDGAINVYGEFHVLGKSDAAGDSSVIITSLTDDRNGLIKLMGSSTDTLMYCKFKHLDQGINVNKSGSGAVYIDNCEFAYCNEEGIYDSGGDITIQNCNIHDNGSDGAYLYNCYLLMDSTTFHRNEKNGLYAYNLDGSSVIENCEFSLNAGSNGSAPEAGIRFYNCSPKMKKSDITWNGEYGIYGANGAYPVLYIGTGKAANTVTDNEDHETYWDSSLPVLDYGHNNFSTEDDTIIYVSGSMGTLNARGNYWGGNPPDTTTGESVSYYGSGTFKFNPYDGTENIMAPRGRILRDLFNTESSGDRIADDSDDAMDAFRTALRLESERPREAISAYREIIRCYPGTAAAPVAVERLLWLTRRVYQGQDRLNELDNINRYFANIADTSRSRTPLVWKAYRAALWALAAQHRYDEAIAGFEAIVQDPDCLADSVFAVIDIGTLHLEARAWEDRVGRDGGEPQAIHGKMHELCPANFPEHRRHTDELLALLGHGAYDLNTRVLIPDDYFLDQNYPNPFNSVTRIRYGLPEDNHVKIAVYDLQGRLVATLVNEPMKAGYHQYSWNGRVSSGIPIASGLYFYRIQAGHFNKVRKMTMIK